MYRIIIFRVKQTLPDISTNNNAAILDDLSDVNHSIDIIKYFFYSLITCLYSYTLIYLLSYIIFIIEQYILMNIIIKK